jgi:CubicO group peptidase (beta-lactamase class C family)
MAIVEPKQSLHGTEDYIVRALAEWQAAGIALAVVQDTEVVYSRGFGVREVGKAARVDPDTLFQVGSTTKAFTTAALGILVDEGKLRWDDPLVSHLPWFKVQDPWITQQLTVRDAVTHRSGILGDWYFVLSIMDSDQTVRNLRYAHSDGPFRDSFHYSNPMYAVAGKLIEAASGSPWGEFVEQRLLKPLGMKRSGTTPYRFWDAGYVAPAFFGSAPSADYGIEHARDLNAAMPHSWNEKGTASVLPWQSYDSAAAAGSLVSTASDMANWLIMHLNEGNFAGRHILRRETARELHSAQNQRVPQNLRFDADQFPLTEGTWCYAMGWFRALYRGQTHLSHAGGILGFPSYVAFIPDRRIGVVVLANGPQPIRDEYALNKAIGFWILDRLLGESQQDWSSEFLARSRAVTEQAQNEEDALQRSRISVSSLSASLAAYAGVYEDRTGRSQPVTVALEDGHLRLKFPGIGAFSCWLEPWHRDLFRLHANAEVNRTLDCIGLQSRFVTFAVDPWRKVTSIEIFGAAFVRTSEARHT